MSFKLFAGPVCHDKTAYLRFAEIPKHMNKPVRNQSIIVLILLLMLPGLAFSSQVFERGVSPELSCSKGVTGDFIVKIRLGEYAIDASGKIQLAEKWKKYRIEQGGETLLAFDLAIDNTGDYRAEISSGQAAKGPVEVSLSRPYIYRDIRGVTLFISPFKTEDGALGAASELEIRVSKTNNPGINQKTARQGKLNPYFIDNYRQLFLNFECRYEDVCEIGSMAIICYEGFLNQMIPYLDWKQQKGIPTSLYPAPLAGLDYDEIKAFIQNLYDTDPTLTFVQLVGDYDQVPSLVYGQNNTYGVRDAHYTLLEGDDSYPDIFVGRFSAETVSELETQITRSLEYEKAVHAGSWMAKAVGACAVNPNTPGDDNEYNWEHLDVIRPKLLNYTFTDVDRVYANEGASTQDLANSLNAGKSLFIYTGEGYETYWITPEFNVGDANALTNDNMLPFIHVVSCLTGQFIDGTCLAEAFMRAQNPVTHEPTGAIGIYAAAPHQGIAPPMRSQDHFVDLLVNGSKNTMGGLVYNGSCNMIDVYGIYGGEYNFLGWNLFGDASLQLRTAYPESLDIAVSNTIPSGTTALIVQTSKPDILACLSKNNTIVASGFTDATGDIILNWSAPAATGEMYKLTCSGFNYRPCQQEILCYTSGEAFLALSEPVFEDAGDGIINSSENIVMSLEITNPSAYAATGVWAEIVCADTLLTLTNCNVQIGTISQGATFNAQLGFRVSKYCPDYQVVQFTTIVHSGSGAWSVPCRIVIHSPRISIQSAKFMPEQNWLNPDDTTVLQCEILNQGSAMLLTTSCTLSTDQTWIQLLQPEKTINAIQSGETCTVSFPIRIKAEAQPNSLFGFRFMTDSVNAPQLAYNVNHLVIPDGAMLESFEKEINEVFLWQFTSGAAWQRTDVSKDGKHCLQTPDLAQNQSSSAEISFIKHSSWSYNQLLVFYLKTGGAPENHLRFYINGVEKQSWSNVTDWQKAEFALEDGATTLKWTYEQAGNPVTGEDFAYLDAIQFPAGSMFSDAVLETETEAVDITIHPDQVIYAPVILNSRDGRYIYYNTILQKDRESAPKDESVWLTFNRNNFTPGDIDTYLVTLYNTIPGMMVTEVSLALRSYTMALSATNFSLQAEQPLTCVSGFPQTGHVIWENSEGTGADSLRCVLVLATDINTASIPLIYHLQLRDTNGTSYTREGYITLSADGASEDFLWAYPFVGSLFEEESERLTLSCFEPTIPEDLSDYRLVVYYNGLNSLSLPVNITYDPTPGIDTSQIRLKAYPNPWSDNLKIEYYLPSFDLAEFAIYNIKGQKVTDFDNKQDYPGQNLQVWDGKDRQGNKLASGIYLIRLKIREGKEKIVHCLLLK